MIHPWTRSRSHSWSWAMHEGIWSSWWKVGMHSWSNHSWWWRWSPKIKQKTLNVSVAGSDKQVLIYQLDGMLVPTHVFIMRNPEACLAGCKENQCSSKLPIRFTRLTVIFTNIFPFPSKKNTTNMNNKKLKLQQQFDLLLYVKISSVI